MSGFRLRQIALVADDLAAATDTLTGAFGLEVAFRDPEIAYFGLENVVMPVGGEFLEIVAPIKDDTSAGRYLERRGAGGYMIILQCTNARAQRQRITGLGIRDVFTLDHSHYVATHFHPADLGGLLLSIDSTPEAGALSRRLADWPPGGPIWREHVREETVTGLTGLTLQADDPKALAALWSKVLDLPLTEGADGAPSIQLLNARLSFKPATDGRGPGLGEASLAAKPGTSVAKIAAARGRSSTDDTLELCGLRFRIEPARRPQSSLPA